MSLLLDKTKKPGTHAIVIGIGRYPWLEGGRKRTFDKSEGMDQLTSPPASAREFANWLLDTYDNPDAPLVSVDLLLSDAKSQQFTRGRKTTTIEAAEFANVSNAIERWTTRATSEKDVLIFFFSGHGIAAGSQTTLLCEDFGSKPLSAMSHAIDFNKLYLGLDRVAPRYQCFFIDACRVGTSVILESFNHYGQAIIDPQAAHNPKSRQAPIFHSTLAGQLAYGRKGKPSYFTEALLRAMRGPGSDTSLDGVTWWVEIDQLLRALPKLLPRIAKNPDEILPQAPGTEISNFPLHRLKGRPAEIPVDVACARDTDTEKASLSWTSGAVSKKRNKKSAEPWQLDLEEGRYTFRAEVAARNGEMADAEIRPHYRFIRIPV